MASLTVAGGNLFAVALDQLGDATQWNRIAALNGLSDPFLSAGLTVLQIPATDSTAGGGVPTQ